MSMRSGCFILLLCLLLGACGGTHVTRNSSMTAATNIGELPAPDSTSITGAYEGISEYRLGPQDMIEVNVFQVADLNRSVRLNSSGQVSLPLIGSLDAGGKTVQELEAEISRRLSERYLQDPQVSVFVKEFASQRVTMEGAVKSPGIYPLTGRTSLLQAIAMAQGLDPLANQQGVVVFRMVDGKKMAAVFDLAAIRTGNAEDPRIYGDDVIVVDQSESKSSLHRFIQTMPLLGLFVLL